jgi:hypothetical protein
MSLFQKIESESPVSKSVTHHYPVVFSNRLKMTTKVTGLLPFGRISASRDLLQRGCIGVTSEGNYKVDRRVRFSDVLQTLADLRTFHDSVEFRSTFTVEFISYVFNLAGWRDKPHIGYRLRLRNDLATSKDFMGWPVVFVKTKDGRVICRPITNKTYALYAAKRGDQVKICAIHWRVADRRVKKGSLFYEEARRVGQWTTHCDFLASHMASTAPSHSSFSVIPHFPPPGTSVTSHRGVEVSSGPAPAPEPQECPTTGHPWLASSGATEWCTTCKCNSFPCLACHWPCGTCFPKALEVLKDVDKEKDEWEIEGTHHVSGDHVVSGGEVNTIDEVENEQGGAELASSVAGDRLPSPSAGPPLPSTTAPCVDVVTAPSTSASAASSGVPASACHTIY